MLSEQEKNRIRAEEIFRLEVRESLEDKSNQHKSKAFWKLINSPFVLFLFSAIIISYLPSYYAKRQVQEKTKVENAKFSNKLDLEISARLNRYHILVVNPICMNDIFEAYKILNTYTVFPEFRAHSLKSLLWQLENVVPENQKAFIAHAIYGYDMLYDKSISMANNYKTEKLKETINDILRNYLSEYFNGRNWLRYSFKK